MSDAYIVRRGKIIQGGGGFDPNGAVLKIVTSTGCSVTVTGTGYSQTQQDGDGFPRSDDENVTEHFFSIPASAFGTINVKSTNTYGDNTKTIIVNTAGKVYEVLCAGINVLFSSSLGLQDGLTLNFNWKETVIDGVHKIVPNNTSWGSALFSNYAITVGIYTKLTATAKGPTAGSRIQLIDEGNIVLCELSFGTSLGTQEGDITGTQPQYPNAGLYLWTNEITEIVLG